MQRKKIHNVGYCLRSCKVANQWNEKHLKRNNPRSDPRGRGLLWFFHTYVGLCHFFFFFFFLGGGGGSKFWISRFLWVFLKKRIFWGVMKILWGGLWGHHIIWLVLGVIFMYLGVFSYGKCKEWGYFWGLQKFLFGGRGCLIFLIF